MRGMEGGGWRRLEGDAPTEFGAEWAFIAGVPLRYTPACILTSLRDYAFVLFHKTFWMDGLEVGRWVMGR